jgi:hypothetical protein
LINDEDKRSDVFLKERPEQYNCIIVKHNRHILRVGVVLGTRIINHSQAKAISVNEQSLNAGRVKLRYLFSFSYQEFENV